MSMYVYMGVRGGQSTVYVDNIIPFKALRFDDFYPQDEYLEGLVTIVLYVYKLVPT